MSKPQLLARALKHVGAVVSRDDSRVNLTHVLIENVDGRLRLRATDGHRLAEVTLPDVPSESLMSKPWYLPYQALKRTKGQAPLSTDEICLDLILTKGTTDVDFRMPDMDQVIPNHHRFSCRLAVSQFRPLLLTAQKRAKLVAKHHGAVHNLERHKIQVALNEAECALYEAQLHQNAGEEAEAQKRVDTAKHNLSRAPIGRGREDIVALDFWSNSHHLNIRVKTTLGDAVGRVGVLAMAHIDGEAVQPIGVNVNYLIDAVALAPKNGAVDVFLVDPLTPIKISVCDGALSSVVMPCRL